LIDIVSATAGDLRLDAFHRGIYWDEFAEQQEPLAHWHAALRGGHPYELTIKLALDGDVIVGGIAYERYPRSGCGLVTYMVVSPAARRLGLGRRLQGDAAADLYARGAPLVLGEINDPRTTTLEPAAHAWTRLARNQKWGARIADTRYVQPALGDGLARDRQLLLIVLAGVAPLPATIDGAILREFLDEFYEVTEGGPPDPEISIPDVVRLVALAP
jgi:GNAT superfamily N-acetyltransferase